MDAERALEAVGEWHNESGNPVEAFWLRVDTNRHHYSERIRSLRGPLPVVPMVVQRGFANPNELMADICHALEDHRGEVEAVLDSSGNSRLAILLLARNDLSLPQVASPATMPSWLAGVGGLTIEVRIRDLAAQSIVPLNGTECRIPEVCEILFRLEGALLRRLQRADQCDHNSGNALFEVLRANGSTSDTYRNLLMGAIQWRRTVANPEAFRPSARDVKSLFGLLVRLMSSSSPDQHARQGKTLARALMLPRHGVEYPEDALVAVLTRSAVRDEDMPTRYMRALLASVFAAYQFVTAAAHADQYPRFSVGLLQGMSLDLRSALTLAVEVLDELPAPEIAPGGRAL